MVNLLDPQILPPAPKNSGVMWFLQASYVGKETNNEVDVYEIRTNLDLIEAFKNPNLTIIPYDGDDDEYTFAEGDLIIQKLPNGEKLFYSVALQHQIFSLEKVTPFQIVDANG